MLNPAHENGVRVPQRVLADVGYKNERDFAELDAMKVDAFVPSAARASRSLRRRWSNR